MTEPSFIYFMRPVGQQGPVKIGFSVAPQTRLACYQAWSPVPLELVAKLEVARPAGEYRFGRTGVQAIERRFHERYLPWHLHHEWFAANALIGADIEAINAGTFDLAVLPEPTAKTWRLPPASRGTKGHIGRPALESSAA